VCVSGILLSAFNHIILGKRERENRVRETVGTHIYTATSSRGTPAEHLHNILKQYFIWCRVNIYATQLLRRFGSATLGEGVARRHLIWFRLLVTWYHRDVSVTVRRRHCRHNIRHHGSPQRLGCRCRISAWYGCCIFNRYNMLWEWCFTVCKGVVALNIQRSEERSLLGCGAV
jgi:hypothetical protein